MNRTSTDINVISKSKPGEVYVFLWQDGQRAELLRVLGRFAASPELSFNWMDASELAARSRERVSG